MTRPGCLALAALTIVFMAGFAVGRASASRPAVQQADRSTGHERMTTERVSPLPSPDFAGRRTEGPMGSPGTSPSPSKGRVTPSPRPTRMQPAATAKPRAATPARHSVSGTAVWYRYRRGHAAAGPLLRKALGAGWRGSTVRVCSAGRCATVVLSDWCLCSGGRRLVDLDVRSFSLLADPSRGVIPVEVKW